MAKVVCIASLVLLQLIPTEVTAFGVSPRTTVSVTTSEQRNWVEVGGRSKSYYVGRGVRLGNVFPVSTRECVHMAGVGEGGMRDAGGSDEQAAPAGGNLMQTLTGANFSVAVGVAIIVAVLANRIATPDLVDSQARTDILGVIASGGLVTNGVYLLDLHVKRAEEVTLVGTFVQEYSPDLVPGARRDLQWLAESLLLVSPATSVVVYSAGKTLSRVGVMGEASVVREDTPILKKCVREGQYGREQYLAALQTLPGKIEFDYLPENCQSVVMLPVLGASVVVVIGANRARAFTPKDIAWMKGLCNQAVLSLQDVVAA